MSLGCCCPRGESVILIPPIPQDRHKLGECSSTELRLTLLANQPRGVDLWDQLSDSQSTHHGTWMLLVPLCTSMQKVWLCTNDLGQNMQRLPQLDAHSCCSWSRCGENPHAYPWLGIILCPMGPDVCRGGCWSCKQAALQRRLEREF